MLTRNIKKTLLAVDFLDASLPVIYRAATLARHFHSEIVMLHVATRLSHAAGVPEPGTNCYAIICAVAVPVLNV
jgi:hypothetical protein